MSQSAEQQLKLANKAFERMGNSDSVRAITRDIENTKRFIRAIRTGGTTT